MTCGLPTRGDVDFKTSTSFPVFLVQASFDADPRECEWDTIRAAFTPEEARAFIDHNRHNYTSMRVYTVPAIGDLARICRSLTKYEGGFIPPEVRDP